ncbi:MAG: HNH endonuclease [Bacteroidota bacterium]
MSRYISPEVRQEVEMRANGCCEYCYSQQFFSADRFTVDHIQPYSKKGSNDPDNLAFSCQGCNRRKYTHTEAVDPQTKKLVPLYNPRKDRWKDHFRWKKSYKELKGISEIGRATIQKLELNRKGVRNLRRVLYESGEHPPEHFLKKK